MHWTRKWPGILCLFFQMCSTKERKTPRNSGFGYYCASIRWATHHLRGIVLFTCLQPRLQVQVPAGLSSSVQLSFYTSCFPQELQSLSCFQIWRLSPPCFDQFWHISAAFLRQKQFCSICKIAVLVQCRGVKLTNMQSPSELQIIHFRQELTMHLSSMRPYPQSVWSRNTRTKSHCPACVIHKPQRQKKQLSFTFRKFNIVNLCSHELSNRGTRDTILSVSSHDLIFHRDSNFPFANRDATAYFALNYRQWSFPVKTHPSHLWCGYWSHYTRINS